MRPPGFAFMAGLAFLDQTAETNLAVDLSNLRAYRQKQISLVMRGSDLLHHSETLEPRQSPLHRRYRSDLQGKEQLQVYWVTRLLVVPNLKHHVEIFEGLQERQMFLLEHSNSSDRSKGFHSIPPLR